MNQNLEKLQKIADETKPLSGEVVIKTGLLDRTGRQLDLLLIPNEYDGLLLQIGPIGQKQTTITDPKLRHEVHTYLIGWAEQNAEALTHIAQVAQKAFKAEREIA